MTHKNIFNDSPNASVASPAKLSNEYPSPACPNISSVVRAIHPFTSRTPLVPSEGRRDAIAWRTLRATP